MTKADKQKVKLIIINNEFFGFCHFYFLCNCLAPWSLVITVKITQSLKI